MPKLRITPLVAENDDIYLVVKTDENEAVKIGPLEDGKVFTVRSKPSSPTRFMKKLAQKQERRNAEMLGARTQPGSGSSSRAKGDIRKLGEYRGESKFTFAESYSLTRAVLEKITSECGEGERPILFLDFKNKMNGRTHGSYVVLHEADFEDLVNNGASDDR